MREQPGAADAREHEDHPSDRKNWKHGLEDLDAHVQPDHGQNSESTPNWIYAGPDRGTGRQTMEPRIFRIGESTFEIGTPKLSVGITTVGGLRIWGTEETTVSFSSPGPRTSGLPKHLEAAGPECVSVYFAVFERELYVPESSYTGRYRPPGMQRIRAPG